MQHELWTDETIERIGRAGYGTLVMPFPSPDHNHPISLTISRAPQWATDRHIASGWSINISHFFGKYSVEHARIFSNMMLGAIELSELIKRDESRLELWHQQRLVESRKDRPMRTANATDMVRHVSDALRHAAIDEERWIQMVDCGSGGNTWRVLKAKRTPGVLAWSIDGQPVTKHTAIVELAKASPISTIS